MKLNSFTGKSRTNDGESQRIVNASRFHGGIRSISVKIRKFKSKKLSPPLRRFNSSKCLRRRDSFGCCHAHSNYNLNDFD